MYLSCSPILYQLTSSLAIYSYGVFIACGIVISSYFMINNKRFQSSQMGPIFFDMLFVSILSGIAGGRLLVVLAESSIKVNYYNCIAIWNGGFSSLGGIIGSISGAILFLKRQNYAILPVLDTVAIYAPLFQSIARLGCLMAGCCHGIPTSACFGIIYTHSDTMAIRNVIVHPTQLYSSLALFLIFLFMLRIAQHRSVIPGQLFATYLMLVSIERFFIDFLRIDKVMLSNWLSLQQSLTIFLFIFAAGFYFVLWKTHDKSI